MPKMSEITNRMIATQNRIFAPAIAVPAMVTELRLRKVRRDCGLLGFGIGWTGRWGRATTKSREFGP